MDPLLPIWPPLAWNDHKPVRQAAPSPSSSTATFLLRHSHSTQHTLAGSPLGCLNPLKQERAALPARGKLGKPRHGAVCIHSHGRVFAQVWAGLCQGLRLSNERDEWGLLPWWGWEEFGSQTGAMPCHLGLCPLLVYNYSHRKRRNCSQFLSKNVGNHWLSTTYLDPLYFIFLLHLPILHYHLFNLEESREKSIERAFGFL